MKSRRFRFQRVSSYVVLTVITLLMVFPFYWMVITSLRPVTQVLQFPPRLFFRSLEEVRWENYVDLFRQQPLFPRYLFNSVYTASLSAVLTCLVSGLAGYAFAKLWFPLRGVLFLLLLSGIMIPAEVTIIPLFSWISRLGLLNSHVPIIVPPGLGLRAVFGTFLMRQFFLGVPNALAESASIDGANPLQTYTRVMAPLSTSAVATVGIITFLAQWDRLLEPLVFLNRTSLYTTPIALSLFTDMGVTQWNLVMSAATIATVPLLVAFFLAQRKFIESVAMSGIK